MAIARVKRAARKKRGASESKLNITSMMDMFTIILVFLIKNYSSGGAIVTPADNLTLPSSIVEQSAKEALNVKIARNTVMVENNLVIDSDQYPKIADQQEFMIEPLYEELSEFARRAQQLAQSTGQEFSGMITIQGDAEIPYSILTRIMYTCGQAGYPNMNLFVYRQD